MLQEIAGIYAEHGKFNEAKELYRVLELKEMCCIDGVKFAAMLRRKANVSIADSISQDQMSRILTEAFQANPTSENARISNINTQAWYYISRGNYKQGYELVKQAYTDYKLKFKSPGGFIIPCSVTAWNIGELVLNFIVTAQEIKPSKYRERVSEASNLLNYFFSEGRARPNILSENMPNYLKLLTLARNSNSLNNLERKLEQIAKLAIAKGFCL